MRKEIDIQKEIEENILVFADKTMVEITFRNILSNAIKFTNQNGKIVVSANQIDKESDRFCFCYGLEFC